MVAAVVRDQARYFRDSIRELDFDVADVLVWRDVYAVISHIDSAMSHGFEHPPRRLSGDVDLGGAGPEFHLKRPVFIQACGDHRAEGDTGADMRRSVTARSDCAAPGSENTTRPEPFEGLEAVNRTPVMSLPPITMSRAA